MHTTLVLYDRFTSELFTKNDEIRNRLVYMLLSGYHLFAQKSNYSVTKERQYLVGSFEQKNNYKLVNKKNTLQLLYPR